MSEVLAIRRRGYTFEWSGGPYVEISRSLPNGNAAPSSRYPERAFEVINVTDSAEPFTRVGLRSLVDAWENGFPTPAHAFRHLATVAHNVLDY